MHWWDTRFTAFPSITIVTASDPELTAGIRGQKPTRNPLSYRMVFCYNEEAARFLRASNHFMFTQLPV
jgi:hypothetical protein